jgi:hypothetical protein
MHRLGPAILAGLVSAALLTACGFGADQPTGRVGEVLAAGDYHLTVTRMENPAERPDRFTNPKAGNRFVKFHVKVDNRGQQFLPIASNYFVLKDSGGVENTAMPGVPSDTGLRPQAIKPGESLEADLFFEMASNLSPSQLVLAPSNIVGWRTRITVNLPG